MKTVRGFFVCQHTQTASGRSFLLPNNKALVFFRDFVILIRTFNLEIAMCWRDDVPDNRHCYSCGATYYGDLGHRGCPAQRAVSKEDLKKVPEEVLLRVSEKVAEALGSQEKAESWLLSYNRALHSFPFEVLLLDGGEDGVVQILGRMEQRKYS